MNILSLFDGISCGRVALERAEIEAENYFASEIDEYAIKISRRNYPEIQQIGNVLNVDATKLPQIDLLLAGSPCQGFSFAGKQLAFDDPRSKLFFEFVRILKECNPKYFILENVKMKKEWLDIITEHVGVEPILINSSLVSAQSRQRYYWTNIPNVGLPHDPEAEQLVLLDILDIDVREIYWANEKLRGLYKGGKYLNSGYKSQGNRVHDIEEKSPTICAGSHGYSNGYVDTGVVRRLTPIECERLQTLPEGYTDKGVSDTQRYKALGNGWTVDVVTHILRQIL
jgi:DNA (cytosine-5)-methyltransferase 3A